MFVRVDPFLNLVGDGLPQSTLGSSLMGGGGGGGSYNGPTAMEPLSSLAVDGQDGNGLEL